MKGSAVRIRAAALPVGLAQTTRRARGALAKAQIAPAGPESSWHPRGASSMWPGVRGLERLEHEQVEHEHQPDADEAEASDEPHHDGVPLPRRLGIHRKCSRSIHDDDGIGAVVPMRPPKGACCGSPRTPIRLHDPAKRPPGSRGPAPMPNPPLLGEWNRAATAGRPYLGQPPPAARRSCSPNLVRAHSHNARILGFEAHASYGSPARSIRARCFRRPHQTPRRHKPVGCSHTTGTRVDRRQRAEST
jgi:hypothetical protein